MKNKIKAIILAIIEMGIFEFLLLNYFFQWIAF